MVTFHRMNAMRTHLGVEVEGCSRKSHSLGEAVTVKAGRGGGFVEAEKGLMRCSWTTITITV